MGRLIRSNLPSTPDSLQPSTYLRKDIEKQELHQRLRTKHNHDNHPQVQDLPKLAQNEPVHVRDLDRAGTVLREVAPRSYSVLTDKGAVRKNRAALISMMDTTGTSDGAEGRRPTTLKSLPDTTGGAEGSLSSDKNVMASPGGARVPVTGGVDAGSTAPNVAGKGLSRPQRLKKVPKKYEDFDLS